MRSLNRVEIIGRLGADPDLRRTQAGDAVATLSVATNEQWTDKQTGEAREVTEWHRCILWRRLAEIAEQYIRKGSRVYLAGQLKTRKWQDNTGQDRYTTEIQCRDMIMLDGQQDSSAQGYQRPATPSYQPAPPQQAAPPRQPNGYQGTTTAPPAYDAPFDDDIPF